MKFRKLIKFCLAIGLIAVIVASFADSANLSTIEPKLEWRMSQYWAHERQSDLWGVLSRDFELTRVHNGAVERQIQFFQRHQDYINELTHNAKPYLFYVYSQTQRHKLPAEIALLPMIESNYNPFGVSRTGATGLWQMMPGTASGLGLKINWERDPRRNVIKSTEAALKHLEYLHHYFGSWLLALAAYDSGDGTVRAAIRYNKQHHLPTDFWHLHLPRETKLYVPKLLALAAIVSHKKHYGLELNPIPNQPYFDGIKMNGEMKIAEIAKLADTDIDTVKKLNPSFKRSAKTPTGSYVLLLPATKTSSFQTALIKSKHHITKSTITANNEQSINTLQSQTVYRVSRGDTLSKLAKKYKTDIKTLKSINHLHSNVIQLNQKLKIPGREIAPVVITHKVVAHKKEIKKERTVSHTITSSDSLSKIAARYHVSKSNIIAWNHLSGRKQLYIGETLLIHQRG